MGAKLPSKQCNSKIDDGISHQHEGLNRVGQQMITGLSINHIAFVRNDLTEKLRFSNIM